MYSIYRVQNKNSVIQMLLNVFMGLRNQDIRRGSNCSLTSNRLRSRSSLLHLLFFNISQFQTEQIGGYKGVGDSVPNSYYGQGMLAWLASVSSLLHRKYYWRSKTGIELALLISSNLLLICQSIKRHVRTLPLFGAETQGFIQDSLGFWILRRRFRISVTGRSRFFVRRTWIQDSNRSNKFPGF